MNRRGFLGSLITALAAPAIIRTPGLLMAVKPLPFDLDEMVVRATERYLPLPQLRIEGDHVAFDRLPFPAGDFRNIPHLLMPGLKQLQGRYTDIPSGWPNLS
jgi:hypothetical protein